MINKFVCKRCIYAAILRTFCSHSEWTVTELEKEFPNLERDYADWYWDAIIKMVDKVPCYVDGLSSGCEYAHFEPLQLDIIFTARSSPPKKCPYILEHTVSMGEQPDA
jgi:hypothetical protein